LRVFAHVERVSEVLRRKEFQENRENSRNAWAVEGQQEYVRLKDYTANASAKPKHGERRGRIDLFLWECEILKKNGRVACNAINVC